MSSTASEPAGEPKTTSPRRHHAVELELNACGVECCPHDAHKGLVAVASYLHRPGDEDTPQSRVGQLYLYDLRPSGDGVIDADVDDADAQSPQTDWSFARVAAPLETRAIFELAWAPASWLDATGPALAQADAGGFVTLYRVANAKEAEEGDVSERLTNNTCSVEQLASLRCGGGGLGMATCVAWGSDCATPASSRLAVVGADGGLRVVEVTETGDLRVTQEVETAHDLEAWAVAFASRDAFHGSGQNVVFSGADDAKLKAWDARAGLDAPAMRFCDGKTHGAGVTCVAPSPHDPHVLATGSYDDVVRLWDARAARKPLTVISAVSLGGGSWRARWHPRLRRLAVAAMDGGAVVLDWDGEERFCHGASLTRNDGGGETLGPGDEDGGDGRDGTLSEDRSSTIASSGLRVSCAYDGHASIAYGADWGWRGAGEGSYSAPDVVVSCSFYDKGLHVWSPAP
jgi:diphthamide biosynthesis protein 7